MQLFNLKKKIKHIPKSSRKLFILLTIKPLITVITKLLISRHSLIARGFVNRGIKL